MEVVKNLIRGAVTGVMYVILLFAMYGFALTQLAITIYIIHFFLLTIFGFLGCMLVDLYSSYVEKRRNELYGKQNSSKKS